MIKKAMLLHKGTSAGKGREMIGFTREEKASHKNEHTS